MFWTRFIHDRDGQPVFFKRELASWTWKGTRWTARLHRFVKADLPRCFHTHPARAFRLILWKGYVEEVASLHYGNMRLRRHDVFLATVARTTFITRGFLSHGFIDPKFCHRVERLLGGSSISLWIVADKTHDIELHGEGWL